jgi:AbrB family looped-hinge helix DNA binding protein
MTQVVLSSKYQIVIPEDVRAELGLRPGQVFDVWALGGHLHVVLVKEPHELFGAFPGIDTDVGRDNEERA